MDGHEKLSELALRMGDIGLPIYGFKDKWSDMVLKIVCLPNCRTPGLVAHLYLDLVEEQAGTLSQDSTVPYLTLTKGISVQLTTDKGTETDLMQSIQIAL